MTHTRPVGATSGRLGSGVALALVAILAVGLTARLWRAERGLPYLYHWDEPRIVEPAFHILRTGDFDPHEFLYPSLLIYTDAAAFALDFLHLAGDPATSPPLSSPADVQVGAPAYPWFISHPSFYLWGRAVTALFGVAAVLLTFFVARRLWGAGTALLAAALLAVDPFHVEHSAYITTDVPAATVGLAAIFFALRAYQDDELRDLGWSFLAVGLAVSTKYNLAFLFPFPLLILLARIRRDGARSLALTLLTPLGFLVATPYALLDLPKFLTDAAYQLHQYLVWGYGSAAVVAGLPHLLRDLGHIDHNFPWHLAWLAIPGLFVALRARGGWLVAAPLALQLWLTSRTWLDYHRNLALAYPLVAVLIAAAISAILERSQRFVAGEHRRTAAAWTVVAAAAVTLGLAIFELRGAWISGHAAVDARSAAVAWVGRQLRDKEAHVTVAAELRVHPSDLRRLGGRASERPALEILCGAAAGDWRLLGGRYGSLIAGAPEALATTLNGLVARGSGWRTFGWRGSATSLTHISKSPYTLAWAPGDGLPALPPVCWPQLGLDDWRLSRDAHRVSGGGAAVRARAVRVGPSGEIASPVLAADAGGLRVRWSIRRIVGPPAARFRAELVAADTPGQVVAWREVAPDAGAGEQVLQTALPHPERLRFVLRWADGTAAAVAVVDRLELAPAPGAAWRFSTPSDVSTIGRARRDGEAWRLAPNATLQTAPRSAPPGDYEATWNERARGRVGPSMVARVRVVSLSGHRAPGVIASSAGGPAPRGLTSRRLRFTLGEPATFVLEIQSLQGEVAISGAEQAGDVLLSDLEVSRSRGAEAPNRGRHRRAPAPLRSDGASRP